MGSVLAVLAQAVVDVVVTYYLQILAGLATFSISAIGVYVAVRNYRINQQNAAKAPKLVSYAYDRNVHASIYVALPYDGKTHFAVPIHFIVGNSGDRSAKHVQVWLEVSDLIYRHEIQREADKISTIRQIELAADEGKNEYIARVFYGLSDIPPRTSVDISDFVFSHEPSVRDFDVPFTSKDGVNAIARVKLAFAYSVTAHIVAEDLSPISLRIDINFRRGGWDTLDKMAEEETELIRLGGNRAIEQEVTVVSFKEFRSRTELLGGERLVDARSSSIQYTPAIRGPQGLLLGGKIASTSEAPATGSTSANKDPARLAEGGRRGGSDRGRTR